MSRLRLVLEYPLEYWGVRNLFEVTSTSSQHPPITDIRTFVIHKFIEARNRLWKDKATAVDALLKNVVFLPVGSVLDADNKCSAGNGIIMHMVASITLNISAIILGYIPYQAYRGILNGKCAHLNNLCILDPFPAIMGIGASICLYFGMKSFYSQAIKVAAVAEDRMEVIYSNLNNINELYNAEKRLNEGQKAYCNLLATCKGILGYDFIKIIGLEIFENTQKQSPDQFPMIIHGC